MKEDNKCSDDESEDDYFERMQEHADNLFDAEEGVEIDCPKQRTYADDESYYNDMIQRSTEISLAAPENDMAWQRLARSLAAQNKSVSKYSIHSIPSHQTSTLFLIAQWLFGMLPSSCKVYGKLKSIQLCLNESARLWVDDPFCPSLAMITDGNDDINVSIVTTVASITEEIIDCCTILKEAALNSSGMLKVEAADTSVVDLLKDKLSSNGISEIRRNYFSLWTLEDVPMRRSDERNFDGLSFCPLRCACC